MATPSAPPPEYYGNNQPGYPPPYQPGAYSNPGVQPGNFQPPAGQPWVYPVPQPGGYPSPQPGGYPPPQSGGYHQSQPEGLSSPQGGGYPPPQQGVYPGFFLPSPQQQGGYPGQPQPPFVPPTIPLHPSFGGMQSPGYGGVTIEGEEDGDMGTWDDRNVRRVFVRKVYTILMLQLLVTFGIVAVFTFNESVERFVRRTPAIYWTSYGVFFVTYLVLICCTKARRMFPLNYILLSVFTLAMAYMTGMLASYYSTKSVLMCLGITAMVCAAVTLFCFQTKFDFTSCHGLMFVLSMALLLTGLVAVFTVPFGYIPWIQTVYAGLGAVVFTLFLAFDTQLLLGNRRHSISPEEHVYGALSLYMDIVYIFTFMLQLFGTRD
ncbi:protein lifeguard 2-like [Lethenteron reissneri]|uniref:protein lifeguard 2-like n=1 Tax=Lethenteron reissneri TaxID=7753 RepID=UPI002AB5DEBF|nr:protein lifeguard 2-like [Lethenteron reissneri]